MSEISDYWKPELKKAQERAEDLGRRLGEANAEIERLRAAAVGANVGAAQPIETSPKKGEFLAPNKDGDWMKVRRFDAGPLSGGDISVINARLGRWWCPDYWMPLPAAVGAEVGAAPILPTE